MNKTRIMYSATGIFLTVATMVTLVSGCGTKSANSALPASTASSQTNEAQQLQSNTNISPGAKAAALAASGANRPAGSPALSGPPRWTPPAQ